MPATLARLATIPNIVGVKEASGNITQMAEICRAVPPDFLVLSGDDAMTLPLMAIGGRGIVSVASNEVPAEMVQMVEAAERGDFATARRWHDKLLPIMQINFVESSPGPGEVRDGGDGALRAERTVCRWCRRAGRAGEDPAAEEFGLPAVALSSGRLRACQIASAGKRPARLRCMHMAVEQTITVTRSPQGASADKAAARDAFFELQRQLGRGEVRAAEPDPASPTGWRVNAWVKQGILLGFRFGDTVDVSADHGHWPFYDKDTMPLKKPGVGAGVRIVPGGSTIREGAFVASQRRVHAADVRQHRRVHRRRLARRFARARRIVRADRHAVCTSAPARRSAASSSRSARCPSSSKTTCWSAGIPASMKAPSSSSARCIAAGVVLTASTPMYDLPRGVDHQAAPTVSRWSCRKAPSSCPARAR